jgi:hypothetical protein
MVASTLFGQTERAILRGTVKDPSGALVLNATVVVTEEATNVEARRVPTDANGNFEIPDLKPGSYQVKVEQAGFRSFIAAGVLLDPGKIRRLDVSLAVGSTTESVTVTAGAALIQTETGQISGELNKVKFTDMPLVDVYPSPLSLMTTTPGVQGSGWTMRIAGQGGGQQNWAMDGVRGTDQLDNPVFFEVVQVTAAGAGADAERVTGFNMVSKRGSSDFHGSFFYKHENSGLNAKIYTDSKKSPFILHEAEVEVGGPIIRGRTFFFVGYFMQNVPLGFSLQRSVPTLKMRAGDFSQFTKTLTDPTTGLPFSDKLIPQTRWSGIGKKLLGYYPTPNLGGPDVMTNNYELRHPYNNEYYKGEWPFVRLDHRLMKNNNLSFRWMRRSTPYIWPGQFAGMDMTQYRDHRNISISDTHVFGASLVNSFTFARQTDFQRQGETEKSVTPQRGDTIVKALGLQGVNDGNFSTMGWPTFSVSGLTALSMGRTGGVTDDIIQDQFIHTFQNTLSWMKGKHALKVGMEDRYTSNLSGSLSNDVYGNFNFASNYTGNGFGDLLLGIPYTTQRIRGALVNRLATGNQLALFVNDSFKVTSKLTLDYGLRWDYYGITIPQDGLMWNYDPKTGNIVVPQGLRSKVSPLYPTNLINVVEGEVVPTPGRRNLRPRVSAAYRITNKTVIRGGFGDFTQSAGSVGSGGPFQMTETYNNVLTAGVPLLTMDIPFPTGASASVPTQSATEYPLKVNYGLMRQFTFTLEREVASLGLRASYIGHRSTHENFTLNTNKPAASLIKFTTARRPKPQFNSTTETRTDGETRYDSLQFEVLRRAGQVTFNASYTLSNSMGNNNNTEDPYNPIQWSRDSGNRRNYFVASATWNVPVGKGRQFLAGAPAVVDQVLGGWGLQSITTIASGSYFSPSFSGSDPSNTNTSGGRPTRIANGNLPADQRTYDKWFDASAFMAPLAGTFGNCGSNVLASQGIRVQHLSVFKVFPIREWLRATFTSQFSDLFNTPHFNNPNSNISNPDPGKFTGVIPYYNPEKQGFRQISFKLRFDF